MHEDAILDDASRSSLYPAAEGLLPSRWEQGRGLRVVKESKRLHYFDPSGMSPVDQRGVSKAALDGSERLPVMKRQTGTEESDLRSDVRATAAAAAATCISLVLACRGRRVSRKDCAP